MPIDSNDTSTSQSQSFPGMKRLVAIVLLIICLIEGQYVLVNWRLRQTVELLQASLHNIKSIDMHQDQLRGSEGLVLANEAVVLAASTQSPASSLLRGGGQRQAQEPQNAMDTSTEKTAENYLVKSQELGMLGMPLGDAAAMLS